MKRSSFERYKLKKTLEVLEKKKGFHTELVSLYIPPDRPISDVTNYLKQEYGTASNIKSKSTRKNVMDAIQKILALLKNIPRPPPTGLAVFCGAIPTNGQGTEKMELTTIVPPEPINTYKYHCNNKFFLDPLKGMLVEKDTYGIIVLDRSEADFAILKGNHLEILKKITSGAPGKHRAGGQSARRFERLIEQAGHEFFKRSGDYANEFFLEIPDLKGILIGGPGPSKNKFAESSYFDYRLKNAILGIVDLSYTGSSGIDELIDKSRDILQNVRYSEEKTLVQKFLTMLVKDDTLVAYGEKEVRQALDQGAVDTLLLSEDLEIFYVTVSCPNCNYSEELTIKKDQLPSLEQEIQNRNCPSCDSSLLSIKTVKPIIDEFGELAEQTGANVEIISSETEEGQQLKQAFGGIAALLRYSIEG
ncbi:MAG: peptide chain release factor aRF-1 [Candidatus Jordarchaeum sp.]|uniref:peptide chain release factor aRF-1 n=1 Tax=Candidatus Jordarchaeum sp. TaxID=2823881 RepID=UPI004049C8D8